MDTLLGCEPRGRALLPGEGSAGDRALLMSSGLGEEGGQVTYEAHMLTGMRLFYDFLCDGSQAGGPTGVRTLHVPHKLSESKVFILLPNRTTDFHLQLFLK